MSEKGDRIDAPPVALPKLYRSTVFFRSDLDSAVEWADVWALQYEPSFRAEALRALAKKIVCAAAAAAAEGRAPDA